MSPVDRKKHKYYPDFIIEMKNKLGKIETVMIEVKPIKTNYPTTNQKECQKVFECSQNISCESGKVGSGKCV